MNKWALVIFVMLGYDAGRFASLVWPDSVTPERIGFGFLLTFVVALFPLLAEERARQARIRALRPEKRQ